MRRRIPFALTLALLSAISAAYFLDYRFGAFRCSGDVCEIGAEDGLILPLGKDFDQPTGNRVRIGDEELPTFRHGTMGIFVRAGTPIAVGLIGGVLTPILFALGALLALLFGRRRILH